MPHDSNGTELEVGDIVNIEFEVTAVWPGEVACNVTLKATAEIEGEHAPALTTNTKFCTKL